MHTSGLELLLNSCCRVDGLSTQWIQLHIGGGGNYLYPRPLGNFREGFFLSSYGKHILQLQGGITCPYCTPLCGSLAYYTGPLPWWGPNPDQSKIKLDDVIWTHSMKFQKKSSLLLISYFFRYKSHPKELWDE